MARLVAGPEAADVITRLLPVASPVQLTSSAPGARPGRTASPPRGHWARFPDAPPSPAPTAPPPTAWRWRWPRATGRGHWRPPGLPGLRAGQGPAKLDLTIDPRSDGTAAFDGRLTLGDAVASGTGAVRLGSDGTVLPTLDMRLEGADLPHLLAASGATDGAVPGVLTFTLSRGPACGGSRSSAEPWPGRP